MPIAAINHIELDDRGVAYIAGTRMKVHLLMATMNANRFSSEQMVHGYPTVSPAQMYAALSYYYDHKAEVDRRIEDDQREFDRLATEDRQSRPEMQERLRKAAAERRAHEAVGR
jgi:uncharacterized protein (DUF433 family)